MPTDSFQTAEPSQTQHRLVSLGDLTGCFSHVHPHLLHCAVLRPHTVFKSDSLLSCLPLASASCSGCWPQESKIQAACTHVTGLRVPCTLTSAGTDSAPGGGKKGAEEWEAHSQQSLYFFSHCRLLLVVPPDFPLQELSCSLLTSVTL